MAPTSTTEAAVAGAVPFDLRESLAGDRIFDECRRHRGLATNFILCDEHEGLSYRKLSSRRRVSVFAEADPTADVEGFDAAAKCSILASLAFHTRVSIDDVAVEGITAYHEGGYGETARINHDQAPRYR